MGMNTLVSSKQHIQGNHKCQYRYLIFFLTEAYISLLTEASKNNFKQELNITCPSQHYEATQQYVTTFTVFIEYASSVTWNLNTDLMSNLKLLKFSFLALQRILNYNANSSCKNNFRSQLTSHRLLSHVHQVKHTNIQQNPQEKADFNTCQPQPHNVTVNGTNQRSWAWRQMETCHLNSTRTNSGFCKYQKNHKSAAVTQLSLSFSNNSK